MKVHSVDYKLNDFLGSKVQKEKYQISVATLSAVLQTEIKDNP